METAQIRYPLLSKSKLQCAGKHGMVGFLVLNDNVRQDFVRFAFLRVIFN